MTLALATSLIDSVDLDVENFTCKITRQFSYIKSNLTYFGDSDIGDIVIVVT